MARWRATLSLSPAGRSQTMRNLSQNTIAMILALAVSGATFNTLIV